MFDTLHVHPTETQFVTKNVNIQEFRAPTDDSIRLYEETKEKAYASILASIKEDGNIVKYNAIVYRDLYSYKLVVAYRLLFNGKTIENKYEIDTFDADTKIKLREKVFEVVSRHLAADLLTEANEKQPWL